MVSDATTALDANANADADGSAAPEAEASVAADASAADASDGAALGCALCEAYGPTMGQGRWRTSTLREVSGIVASQRHPGVYWVHNDSGDTARIFAVRPTGEVLGEYAIDGANAVDWEDIAVAPCADGTGSCIVIGDVGDNSMARTSVDLYRVREPEVIESSANLRATRFRVRYPSGAMNCEAIVVDRRDGSSALLIEKREPGAIRLVRVDLTGMGGDRMGEELGTIPGFGALVTAADMHPCSPTILVRTYASAWEMRGSPADSLAQIASNARVERPTAAEVQGEAIGYTFDGRGYLSTSEGLGTLITGVFCGR
jgi:hypothetical protein